MTLFDAEVKEEAMEPKEDSLEALLDQVALEIAREVEASRSQEPIREEIREKYF
jgi:hypothetical protein